LSVKKGKNVGAPLFAKKKLYITRELGDNIGFKGGPNFLKPLKVK